MTKAEALVTVMDEAARRVLSGTERAYDIALEACADLVYLDANSDSPASWSAYVLWAELTDIVELWEPPESEQLCNELAGEFSRTWLELPDRRDESAQAAFMIASDLSFRKRMSEHMAAQ